MKRWITGLLAGLGFAAMAFGSMEEALPVWKDGDVKALEAEGWFPGRWLLTHEPIPDDQQPLPESALDVEEAAAEEITEAEEPLNEIPERFWTDYFAKRPESFLVDPQGLLSPVDQKDRLEFLNYHASDSTIDLFVYVFGGDQEIPGEVREEELVERLYSTGRPAAVVYYYLDAPQRSVLYLSPSLTDLVSAAEQRRALESSVQQALEKPNSSSQLEAFLVQMSIRLYWMERMMGVANGPGAAPVLELPPEKTSADEKNSKFEKLKPYIAMAEPYAIPAAGAVAAGLLSLVLGWWMKRRTRYRFPDFEVEPRLGGSHAAGIGAVISFASASLPPASQRDQVPDYLRRM